MEMFSSKSEKVYPANNVFWSLLFLLYVFLFIVTSSTNDGVEYFQLLKRIVIAHESLEVWMLANQMERYISRGRPISSIQVIRIEQESQNHRIV